MFLNVYVIGRHSIIFMKNEPGYTIYVIDTETTGLSEDSEIVELSACRFNLISPDKREQQTWYIRAMKPEVISDEALQINGHKREDILHLTKEGKEKYKYPKDAVSEIENWIFDDNVSVMDRIFGGQNPVFDIDKMKVLWKSVNSIETFPFAVEKGNRTLDTKQLALICDLVTGKRRQQYNLTNLVKSFKVKKRKAHRAEDDVAMTTDLLISIIGPIRELVKTRFEDCYE